MHTPSYPVKRSVMCGPEETKRVGALRTSENYPSTHLGEWATIALPREVSLPIHWCVFDFSQVLRGCSTQQKGVGKKTQRELMLEASKQGSCSEEGLGLHPNPCQERNPHEDSSARPH